MPTPDARRAARALWIAVAILALVAVVAHETTLAVSDTTAWVEHTHEVLERLAAEREALAEAESARLTHGITGDDAVLVAYTDAVHRIEETGRELRMMTADNASQQERLDALEPLVEKRIALFDVAIDRKRRDADSAQPETERSQGRALDGVVFAILSDMRGEELRLLERRRSRTARNVLFMRLIQASGTILSLFILLVAFGRLRRETASRIRSEQAARESEESLATTLMSIGDGVISTDTKGHVVKMNRVAEQLTGWSASAAVGKPVSDIFHIVHRETRAAAPDPVQHALREGGVVALAGDTLLVRKDGSELPIADSCAPVRDATGNVRGAVLVFRDVSEAERARALQDSVQRQMIFSDRMVAVGTLAAGVAHEINNPLAYVLANLDMVIEEARTLSRGSPSARLLEIEEMAVEARQGAGRVQKIVRGLKTFSRADEDRRIVLDVRSVIELAINMAFNEIRQRARLVKDYGPIPLVDADEARLGQVLVNLLINAAQAIPEGDVASNEIRITTSTDASGRAVVTVRDTGSGIPEAARGRIFDPFFTTKPVGVGTGLGLSICHNIITGMAGEIGVSSEPGLGTTFRVTLPASAGAIAVGPQASEPPVQAPRAAILVVDDERQVGNALARLLRPHEVVVVTRAQDALGLLAKGEQFDMILTDLMMPTMSGMDLYDELARRYPEAAERVVFVTGGAFTPAAKSFLDRVSNERIEKPFDAKTLRALVQTRLAGVAPQGLGTTS